MDNHQLELAEALEAEKYLSWCYPDKLLTKLQEIDWDLMLPYPAAQSDLFSLLIFHELGSS